ncbi:MAG: hypothetical protein GTO45_10355 [Candidatus Aminicenantes bacterium]|nr:hypothetical protein [Candidatus Aminicenantes bacterium]NIM79211.1 hypothetical protein [Candidatus Aminicenantes bacterium]NIN18489.1 hypothetical protein [Candidatus Aminicenantes bacterium]NIN42385.1 hypothetical protein [Candidatus Aminicenantes bacterium]NIN85151.1 hypothetical protein [Candidatus Aminicenantes bacterium]
MNDLKEFKFKPRVINPVKITNASIFSADEDVRKTINTFKENMPWIHVDIVKDPISASNYKFDNASVFIFDDTAMTIVDTTKIKKNNNNTILALLSSNGFIHYSPPSISRERFPYTANSDLVFAVDKREYPPDHIIAAVVRCAEDRLNIEKYSKERRFIFLIVDDEPRWFSQFLPVLYNIIGQRADIMVTRTYEETLKFIFGVEHESEIDEKSYLSHGHGDDVVCIITDIFFPKGNNLKSDAGKDLINLINKYYRRIPIIVASKAKVAEDLKNISFIMPKGDPGSLQTLKNYIHNFTGMGDFLIRSKSGEELYRFKNIREMYETVLKAEKNTNEAKKLRELLEIYGQKDWFSTWLYMHGYKELGDKLRPRQAKGHHLVKILKNHLKREIQRMNYTPLIIDKNKIFNLDDLLNVLRTVDPCKIQKFSDNDLFSTWLDHQGYPELAEELRPIHNKGAILGKILSDIVEKWIKIYKSREKGDIERRIITSKIEETGYL